MNSPKKPPRYTPFYREEDHRVVSTLLELGGMIRSAREQLGLTIEEVAAKLDFDDPALVQSIEEARGLPGLDILFRIGIFFLFPEHILSINFR